MNIFKDEVSAHLWNVLHDKLFAAEVQAGVWKDIPNGPMSHSNGELVNARMAELKRTDARYAKLKERVSDLITIIKGVQGSDVYICDECWEALKTNRPVGTIGDCPHKPVATSQYGSLPPRCGKDGE